MKWYYFCFVLTILFLYNTNGLTRDIGVVNYRFLPDTYPFSFPDPKTSLSIMIYSQNISHSITLILIGETDDDSSYWSTIEKTHKIQSQLSNLNKSGYYYLRLTTRGNQAIKYRILFYMNGTLNYTVQDSAILPNMNGSIYSSYWLQINQTCGSVIVEVQDPNYFANMTVFDSYPTKSHETSYKYVVILNQSRIINAFSLNSTGTWFFLFCRKNETQFTYFSSQEIRKKIRFQCVIPCGDGIRQVGEQCDNRNTTGCINCTISKNYVCTGDVGKLSICQQCPVLFYVTAGICQINCSLIENSIGPDLNTTNTCICFPLFEFNKISNKCIIKCSSIKNTNGLANQSSNACTCIRPYIWEPSNSSCVPNCIAPLIFNQTMVQCVINCSNIKNAISLAPGSADTCTCKPNYFWQNSTCVLNCNAIKNTAGLANDDVNACACRNNFIWSPSTFTCTPDCPVPFTLNSTLNQCVLVCSNILNAYSLPNGNCACKQNYTWRYPTVTCVKICTLPLIFNETLQKCVVNCANISNTIRLAQNTTDTCICLDPYAWRISTSTCVPNCPTPSIFNNTMKKCVINCTAISNTIGLVSGTNNTCECKTAFKWQSSNFTCIPNCIQPLVFNQTLNKCIINCSNIPKTLGLQEGKTNICKCKSPYTWRASSYNCIPSCTLPLIFNQTQELCVINCLTIKYSAGLLEGTTNTCKCQPGFTWIPASNSSPPSCSPKKLTSSNYSPDRQTQPNDSQCQICNLQSKKSQSQSASDYSVLWVILGTSMMTVAALGLICYVKICRKAQFETKRIKNDDTSDKGNIGSTSIQSEKNIKRMNEENI